MLLHVATGVAPKRATPYDYAYARGAREVDPTVERESRVQIRAVYTG